MKISAGGGVLGQEGGALGQQGAPPCYSSLWETLHCLQGNFNIGQVKRMILDIIFRHTLTIILTKLVQFSN